MKKLLLALCMGSTLAASAVTVDDLCGKIVGQVFWGNSLHSMQYGKSVPVYIGCGVFTKVPGYSNRIKLSFFKNAEDVIFELNGNTLSLVNVGSGANYTDSEGGTVTLRVQTPYNYTYSSQNYYSFANYSSGVFNGEATTLSDGTIKFELDGDRRLLQFQKYSSHGININTFNDFLKTYYEIDLYIYAGNGEMTYSDDDNYTYSDEILVKRNDTADKTNLSIRNFGGFGWMYHYNNQNQNSWQMMEDGIDLVIDNASDEVTISRQTISGLTAPYGTALSQLVNSSAGYLPFFRSQYTVTSDVDLSSLDNGAITGKYTAINGEHTTWHPWDKQCGGNLVTSKTASITISDWAIHYHQASTDTQEMFNYGNGTELVFTTPATHTGEMVIDGFKVNCDETDPENTQKNNVYVKCHLENVVNNRLIENYELCMVPGNFTSINANHGLTIDDNKGFSQVVNLSERGYNYDASVAPKKAATLKTSEDGSFEMAVPYNAIKDAGFDFNKDTNKYTFFVKANYKEGSAADGGRLAPTFHALAYTNTQVPTSIDAASFDANISIKSVAGGVEVEGADFVEVYNVAGAEVYSGAAGTIDLPAGLYIVRADGKTAKVNVK